MHNRTSVLGAFALLGLIACSSSDKATNADPASSGGAGAPDATAGVGGANAGAVERA